MVEEAVEALMRTLIIVRLANGKTRRVQFLGGNDMDDPDRPAGVLVDMGQNRHSGFNGPVLEIRDQPLRERRAAFKSDAENMAGLQPGRVPRNHRRPSRANTKTFGELNKHVLKPAVAEINALAPFNVNVLPVKKGKKVVEVRVGWWVKESGEAQAAFQELNRSKVGRKARISGTVQHVSNPLPSADRLRRQARLTA
jgi:hypothetical protein